MIQNHAFDVAFATFKGLYYCLIMRIKLAVPFVILAVFLVFSSPTKAQIETALTVEQFKIFRSRAYLSGEDARQFDLLLSSKNRTTDEEAKLRSLVDSGIALFNEGNELSAKAFRTLEEEQQMERIKSLVKQNEMALLRVIGLIYSPQAFSLASASLPANYEGISFDILSMSLANKFDGKQEFETSTAYAERIKNAEKSPLVGQLSPQSVFSSRLNPEKTSAQYDADKQIMKLSFSLSSLSDADKTKSLEVSEATTSLDSYTGTNAYGAEVKVLSWKEQSSFLVHDNNKQFKFKFDIVSPKITVSIPMLPMVAMEAKPDIRVLAVYRLKKPYIGSKSYRIPPTIKYPYDRQIVNNYLTVELLSLWFYNGKTGVIYRKLQPQGR